jgi:hypothetical protein
LPGISGRVEGALTYMGYSADRMGGRNLFQPGTRLLGDLAYSVGATTVYGANLWRQSGEATAPIIAIPGNTFLRDTILPVGWQNLAMVGVRTNTAVGGVAVEPVLEYKLRSREDAIGRGWLVAGGATIPLVVRDAQVFPSLRLTRGSMIPSVDASSSRGFWGLELSVIARYASRP